MFASIFILSIGLISGPILEAQIWPIQQNSQAKRSSPMPQPSWPLSFSLSLLQALTRSAPVAFCCMPTCMANCQWLPLHVATAPRQHALSHPACRRPSSKGHARAPSLCVSSSLPTLQAHRNPTPWPTCQAMPTCFTRFSFIAHSWPANKSPFPQLMFPSSPPTSRCQICQNSSYNQQHHTPLAVSPSSYVSSISGQAAPAKVCCHPCCQPLSRLVHAMMAPSSSHTNSWL